MKKSLVSLIAFALFCCSALAQTNTQISDTDCAAMSFTRDTLDVGILKHNVTGVRIMQFKNTGKCPLVISSVSGMPRAQYFVMNTLLQPNDTASVRIFYPATEPGRFFKCLSFYTNSGVKQLYIKGAVLPEEVCAGMSFASDTVDLGPLPYVNGKHFVVKVLSNGHCPLMYTVTMPIDYMNVTHFEGGPIPPQKFSTIDIHIGGEVAGNYYGVLNVSSTNAEPAHKTLFVRAEFLPPATNDLNETEIKVDRDIMNMGHIYQDSTKAQYTIQYKVTNLGDKPLLLTNTQDGTGSITIPDKPILPGKTGNVIATFNAVNILGPFVWHIVLQGNFKGKAMPLYVSGNITR